MAIDPTAVQPGANATTPPSATADQLLNLIAPGIQQTIADRAGAVATDVANQLHSQSVAAIADVRSQVEGVAASLAPKVEQAVGDAIPQIKAEVLKDITALSDNVQHDKITQRWVVLSGIQIGGQITFLFVFFYFLGSPEAKGIVGWAGASGLATALLGWASTGFKLPRQPAAS